MIHERKHCLCCGRSLRSPERQLVIRGFLRRNDVWTAYPKLYPLLERVALCAACLQELPLLVGECCPRCGRADPDNSLELKTARRTRFCGEGHPTLGRMPRLRGAAAVVGSGAAAASAMLCRDCVSWGSGDPLAANRAALRYEQWSKELIFRWKYRGDERIAELFAVLLLVTYVRCYANLTFDLLSFVPLHDERLRERGFNQAERMSRLFAKYTGIRLLPLLKRVKETVKQSKQQGRRARLESMQDAFAIDELLLRSQAGILQPRVPLRLLLIDDIFTTGATIRACAHAIHSHPLLARAEVYSLTICR